MILMFFPKTLSTIVCTNSLYLILPSWNIINRSNYLSKTQMCRIEIIKEKVFTWSLPIPFITASRGIYIIQTQFLTSLNEMFCSKLIEVCFSTGLREYIYGSKTPYTLSPVIMGLHLRSSCCILCEEILSWKMVVKPVSTSAKCLKNLFLLIW